ncbi:hypothetical protein ASL11_34090 [Paenibacillus sp. Soil750]|nr:hypothetical protein ASL11_34090 [Paenibacillus sp. Soil750]
MKISKKAFFIINIISAFLSVLGITGLFFSYKVTSWVKNIEQIKLGYLDIFAVCSIFGGYITQLLFLQKSNIQ